MPLIANRESSVLMVNGTQVDVARGKTYDWIAGEPERMEGIRHVTLTVPRGTCAEGNRLSCIHVAKRQSTAAAV